ncbi:MAG TPA: alpha/beta fold hydrolase [Blastocatellia bacterium]|nr:alpha/beta fold hydrolase [Blastocatellia bacterium]
MYVKKFGSGTVAYFGLHGWGGDHRTFAPLAARLPEGAALYCPDLPGYGLSPAPRKWSLAAIAEEIVAAISEIDAPRVTLIGNCSGAILGLFAAEAAGERIERLVLIDPFAFIPWYFRVFTNTSFGKYAYHSTFANPFGRWITNLSLRNRRAADSDLTGSFKRVNHEVSFQYLKLLAATGDIAQFRDLRMPIDIVYGEKTFGAVKQSVALWQGIWPHARCHRLAGAGHLPIEEAAAQLSDIAFVTRRECAVMKRDT